MKGRNCDLSIVDIARSNTLQKKIILALIMTGIVEHWERYFKESVKALSLKVF